MQKVKDIRKKFIDLYNNEEFVIDKTGVKTIELIGESFIADEDWIIRKPNYDYAKREIQWYESQSLNVWDIPGKVPLIWQQVSDKDGYINSNYGWCIWSKENHEQYINAIRELKKNKDSRRATMIYTRPTMHTDYNKNGMSDFICTWGTHIFIRNNKLIYQILQRSVDSVFGYCNDFLWHQYVRDKLYLDLKDVYPELEKGNIIYTTGSLHVYERHFKFLEELI